MLFTNVPESGSLLQGSVLQGTHYTDYLGYLSLACPNGFSEERSSRDEAESPKP